MGALFGLFDESVVSAAVSHNMVSLLVLCFCFGQERVCNLDVGMGVL